MTKYRNRRYKTMIEGNPVYIHPSSTLVMVCGEPSRALLVQLRRG